MDNPAAFDAVCALQAEGQFLAAYDRAVAAIAAGDPDGRLRHRAVLALAQSGASAPALALYQRLGLGGSTDPEDTALGARLLKDQALAVVPGAAHAAEAAYAASWQRSRLAWHGINAAAMALLAGAPDRARARAAAIGTPPDTGDYWSAATMAEAALLQGDIDACAAHLDTAEQRAGPDLAARHTTRRQLRWIAALLGAPPALAEILRIPPSLHFCGAIPRGPDAADPAPEAALRAQLGPALAGVRAAFGSLAAGADIVIAEALLEAGAELTVVLPFPPDQFAAASVRPSGADWVPRFRACLARARVVVLEDGPHDALDFAMASRRAMGLARLHAARLDGAVRQVAVPKPDAPIGVAGTASDMQAWRQSGGAGLVLESPWQPGPAHEAAPVGRALHAVLFGDLPGFGRLDDAALTRFFTGPLAAIGPLTQGAAHRNTWGDAVKLVFAAPAAAAQCALAIQRTLSAEAFTFWDLPPTLTPRLALDFGPLRPVHDAVRGAGKFAGRVMTRAARIEPVTPPGSIYATEAFACEMALLAHPPVACDYAGLVPAAKGFGTLPLYSVREA